MGRAFEVKTNHNRNHTNTMTNQTQPFGILIVHWDNETRARAIGPNSPLDVDKLLKKFIDARLDLDARVSTEAEHGHSNWAAIYTSDHLNDDITPESPESDLIAACDSCIVVWDSVGFFVDID